MKRYLLLVLCTLALAPSVLSAALDATCYKPKSMGGLGFCGPADCAKATTTTSGCQYTSTTPDFAAQVAKNKCRVCTQSTSSKCSTSFLKSTFTSAGVKAAYCTDTHLVIISDGTPTWSANIDDIPFPPGSVQSDGITACVTRSSSITSGVASIKIPLSFTLASTASALNNAANFPDGATDSMQGYMSTAAGTYTLPTRGAVGWSVTGQEIFPLYNNRAEITPDACEVDSCNEHVGGGGGQPHLHGDPFGSWCLYSAANYSSATAHPPLIGFGRDGPLIYGRHLYTTSLGYSTPLDDCGGHTHDGMEYHYHTQVLDVTVSAFANRALTVGTAYVASTPGPYKCFRSDISQSLGFWDGPGSTYINPCCGMTNYYAASGITINGAGTQASSPPPATNKSPPPTSQKSPPPTSQKSPPPTSQKSPPPSNKKSPPPSQKSPPPSNKKSPPPSQKSPPPSNKKSPPPAQKSPPPSNKKSPPPATTTITTKSPPLSQGAQQQQSPPPASPTRQTGQEDTRPPTAAQRPSQPSSPMQSPRTPPPSNNQQQQQQPASPQRPEQPAEQQRPPKPSDNQQQQQRPGAPLRPLQPARPPMPSNNNQQQDQQQQQQRPGAPLRPQGPNGGNGGAKRGPPA